MEEQPPDGRERGEGMLSMLMASTKEKIADAERLLAVVEAGHGEHDGYEWSDLVPNDRRIFLLHAAKSMALEFGKASIAFKEEMQRMDADASERIGNRLKELE